jgi:zinc and cadmium transporter
MVRPEIVLAVALINFLAAFVGVVLILRNRTWSERNLRWGVGFGAGLLIGTSLLEIIPTAMDLAGEHAMLFVLLGFVGFFLIEKVAGVHPPECPDGEPHFHFSMATFVALCLHALLDGMVIGLGLHFSEAFGLVIFVAILFHKLPLAVSLAGVFLAGSKRRNAVIQMLIFALATPLGLLATVAFLGEIPEEVMGAVVAISAGFFIYLGATDMLPEINHPWRDCEKGPHAEPKPVRRWEGWEASVWVLIGMGVSFIPHLLLEG